MSLEIKDKDMNKNRFSTNIYQITGGNVSFERAAEVSSVCSEVVVRVSGAPPPRWNV